MFKPHPDSNSEPVILEPDELETLRLVDLEGLSQEEAGEKMGISRGTKWRLLQSTRRKTTLALPMEGLSESLRTPRQSLKKQSEHSGTEAACAVSTKSYWNGILNMGTNETRGQHRLQERHLQAPQGRLQTRKNALHLKRKESKN